MDRFIALYRGINVVGKNCVKMQALRQMHERLGHRHVQNYIQSGNIVFHATGAPDALTRKVAAEFVKTFRFPAKVIIMDTRQWSTLIKNNPYRAFAAANYKTVHAGVCQGKPVKAALDALLARTGGTESFTIKNGILYLHAPDGYGTSKFAAGMEKACGVPMTVRNWRTVEAIWKMATAPD